jgi:hypothetical protein
MAAPAKAPEPAAPGETAESEQAPLLVPKNEKSKSWAGRDSRSTVHIERGRIGDCIVSGRITASRALDTGERFLA